jgi:hypothetical protein
MFLERENKLPCNNMNDGWTKYLDSAITTTSRVQWTFLCSWCWGSSFTFIYCWSKECMELHLTCVFIVTLQLIFTFTLQYLAVVLVMFRDHSKVECNFWWRSNFCKGKKERNCTTLYAGYRIKWCRYNRGLRYLCFSDMNCLAFWGCFIFMLLVW